MYIGSAIDKGDIGMNGNETICVTKSRINANQLKLIAIATMVMDHCAVVLLPDDFSALWFFRMIGRMTAPIMCFFIAEGYYHTSNLRKYMGRLLIMAILSHIPHNLCMGHNLWQFWKATDVMFSLLLGLVALTIWKNDRFSVVQKLLGVLVCCLLAFPADWNYIAVLWILGFGIFHGQRGKSLMAFVVVAGIYLIQPWIHGTYFPFISRFGVFLVIPLLLLYNGERGRKSKLIKWGFYWFYPIHLLIIYWIGQLI